MQSGSMGFAEIAAWCRDYCVDLVPKFVMADGLLVKILLKMNAQVRERFSLAGCGA